MLRRRTAALAIAAVTAAVLTTPAAAEPLDGGVQPDGRWLVDQHGRVVLLHGVNTVDKEAPYLAPGEGTTLTEADAKALARHGLNTVRLGVEFDGLMPREGVIDHAYVNRLASTVEVLGEHGIHVLLDNHQDGLSKKWGGNGFPPWSISASQFPLEPNPGFPLYYLMPSMTLGWDEVWTDRHGVVGHLGDALAALVERVGDDPAVLGVELLNEPWPGTAWPTCIPPAGCPAFDAKMQGVWERLTARIRQVDADIPVYWEPQVLWNETAASHLSPTKTPGVVFSFHDYCSFSEAAIYLGLPPELRGACDLQHGRTYENYRAVAERTGWPALITEFGGTGDPTVVARTMPYADQNFLGWQFWHYSSGQDIFSGELGKQLVRTYPQATAGTPVELKYDPDTGAFRYTYRPKDLGVPTEIFVATDRYPVGYRVTVSGGHTLGDPTGSRVRVAADGETPVTVEITAR